MFDKILNPGMKVECTVLHRFSPDRYLVKLSNKEFVMQFTGNVDVYEKVPLQILEVKPDVVLAKIIEKYRSTDDLINEFKLNQSDIKEAIRVIDLLKTLNLPLNEENVKKLLAWRRLVIDEDVALACFLKKIPLNFAEKFKLIFDKDLKKTVYDLEKIIIKNKGIDEKYERSLFSVDPERFLLILENLSKENPWRRFFLTLKDSKAGQNEKSLLKARFDLDDIRSVVVPEYAVFFDTLFWKDSSGWHEADVKLSFSGNGEPYKVEVETDFGSLGGVYLTILYWHLNSKRFEVIIEFKDIDDPERFRRFFTDLGENWNVVLKGKITQNKEFDEQKLWKKIDTII